LFVRRWINSVETNDVKAKTEFTTGLERLVDKAADDNGVWKMMVAASALHEQQTHNLDILQQENADLKSRIDGHYAQSGARLQENSLGKRKAEIELDHFDVAADASSNLWSEFASDMSSF
jgi:hypothetical protein